MPNFAYNSWSLDGQSGLRCRSDDAHIMHPESFFVKERNQPIEEHRPKKLLEQIRACPELAEGMPSASNTIPIAPTRPTSAGSNATSTSAACATRLKWAIPRSEPFSPTWRSRSRAGNTSSRPTLYLKILVLVSRAAITCTRAAYKRRSKRRPVWPAS